ncbi:hypothetical protein RSW15_25090, partial [Escherichia coli]|uniref:hypothetical protein n=1 Tax=Escherichia coli TaxID=562 RepID=UPI0028DF5E50
QTVVASGSEDGTARIWDPATGRETITLTGHDGPVLSVAFGQVAGRTVLASGSADGDLRLWDPESGATLAVVTDDGGII